MNSNEQRKYPRNGIIRVGLQLGLAIILVAPASVNAAIALAVNESPGSAQASCRLLIEFNVCGRFLEEWSKYGSDQASIYVNGMPITKQRTEVSPYDGKTYDTQWFERAKYEAHLENPRPYDVLLGRLGASLVEGRGGIDPYTKKVRNPADQAFVGVDRPPDADGKNKLWFPETRHSVSGKIVEYWSRYGGLQQFGFPLSEQFQQVSETNGKTYTVQYFERNRFELHLENADPYAVELGLLGVQQYKTTASLDEQLPVAPPPGAKSSKDTLVIGIPRDVPNIYDFAAFNLGLPQPLSYSLVDTDPQARLFGELAWYAPTLENGGARFVGNGENRYLQVKYKLRQGMRWSDGKEIDSNDAIFAYKLTLNPDLLGFLPTDPYLAQKLANMDNPDLFTVIANFMSYAQARDFYARAGNKSDFDFLKVYINAKQPVTDISYYLAASFLVPEHALRNIAPKALLDQGYWSDPQRLVTSGPFKLQEWDRGRQIVLVPNPYFSLTAPPLLKKVILRIVPNHQDLISQLRTGDLDAAVRTSFLAPDSEASNLSQAGLKVETFASKAWEHIDFNLDSPYFKDRSVRQAVAYAINRQRIVDQVSFGQWLVIDSFIPPANWASVNNPNFPEEWKAKFPVSHYNYDPQKANQLLDDAGWVRGPDGIRSKGGVRLSFDYGTIAGNATRPKAQALVQQDLRAVGIDAKIKPVSRDVFEVILPNRNFDLFQLATISDDQPTGALYASGNIPSPDNYFNGNNYAGFRNARYDQLELALELESDRSKLYPVLAEMQSVYASQLPSLPLYELSTMEVHKANLMNWDVGNYNSASYKLQAMYFR